MATINYEKAPSLMALDKDFNLVTIVAYSELQWRRKYHEVGSFVVVVDLEQYSKDWKYIYTKDRKELGVISQVNFQKNQNGSNITISGLFLESEVNNYVCYPVPTYWYGYDEKYGTSVLTKYDCQFYGANGKADEVALDFFRYFAIGDDEVSGATWHGYYIGQTDFSNVPRFSTESDIKIGKVEDGEYKESEHIRDRSYLGNKMYDILNESLASFEVVFDYVNKIKYLNIIHGKDRTYSQTNPDINPMILSTKNGTVSEISIVTSNTNEKDVVVSCETETVDEEEVTIVLMNCRPDTKGRYIYSDMQSKQADYFRDAMTESEKENADVNHRKAVLSEANEILRDNRPTTNISMKITQGSYRYMVDFDLGDKISISVPEIDFVADVQIIGCTETVQNGVWKLDLELGTPIIRKRGRL